MRARRKRRSRRRVSDLRVLSEVLTLLAEILLKCRDDDALCQIRRALLFVRRKLRELHQRGKICSKCYHTILNLITNLEIRLEEYEYEEALRRWG